MFHVLAKRITPRAASYADVIAVFYDLDEAKAHALELNQKPFSPFFYWAEAVPQSGTDDDWYEDPNSVASRHHY